MSLPHSHCSFCGHAFSAAQRWPRTCMKCAQITYRNPLPAVVVLLPVGRGLLVIRRAVEPRCGHLALPGGFIDLGESWQAAGARELGEETGVTVDAGALTVYRVHSAPDSTVLIFALAPPITAAALPPFVVNEEVSERLIISAPQALAFALHSRVVEEHFAERR